MSTKDSNLIHVRFYAAARSAVGVAEMFVEPGSAVDILQRITGSNPNIKRVFLLSSILIDSEILHDRLRYISAGSEMDVLPPFAGGSN